MLFGLILILHTIDYGFWSNFEPNTIDYAFWPNFYPNTTHYMLFGFIFFLVL